MRSPRRLAGPLPARPLTFAAIPVHAASSDDDRHGVGVSGADLTLDDGSEVTGTLQNGWAVAWWPGTHHLAAAHLTTPAGTRTQAFAKYSCDVDNCHGGPHGGAPGGGPGGG
jgi:hypothetical protein